MFEVLLVEDDINSALLTKTVLNRSGFNVTVSHNGSDCLTVLEKKHIDLVVLDVMLPGGMDGYDIAKYIRQMNNSLPILMLTAKETTQDKVKGFSCGVDDYCVKPIDDEELSARCYALLRRFNIAKTSCITLAHTTVDSKSFSVSIDNTTEVLPKKEFNILFKLLSYPNVIFTRLQLMEEFWEESDSDPHTVEVHINRLRNRFKDNQDFRIDTVRGLGYKVTLL